MAATNHGTTVAHAGQRDLTGYIVLEDTVGEVELKSDMIENALGADIAMLVYQRKAVINLRLQVTTGTVATDFPEGKFCTVTGLTDYFVLSAPLVKNKGINEVTVRMVYVFSTDYGS